LQSLDEELEPALEIDAETDTINGTTRRASDLRDVHTDKPFQSPSRTIPLYLQQVEGGYAELSLVLHDVSTAADVRVVAAEEAMRAKLGRLIPVELHANAQESLLTTSKTSTKFSKQGIDCFAHIKIASISFSE